MRFSRFTRASLATSVVALAGASASAAPVTYDGIAFPGGDASFADGVVEMNFGDPAPTAPNYTEPAKAVGAPDYSGDVGSVSLGSGGSIVLEFSDNSLTGSGDADFDLHIFEIGPDVEDTFVDISVDGSSFLSVGSVGGATSSIDIDPFLAAEGLDAFTQFAFVRLMDNPDEGDRSGATVGADIDAVGAISSAAPIEQPPSIPLPAGLPLLAAGLGLTAFVHKFGARRPPQA